MLGISVYDQLAATKIIESAAARFLPSNGCRLRVSMTDFLTPRVTVSGDDLINMLLKSLLVWAFGVLCWEVV